MESYVFQVHENAVSGVKADILQLMHNTFSRKRKKWTVSGSSWVVLNLQYLKVALDFTILPHVPSTMILKGHRYLSLIIQHFYQCTLHRSRRSSGIAMFLVSNVPTEKMEFDLEGLSSIGSLSKPISIQGNMNPTASSWFILLSFISVGAKKGDRNPDNLIQTGTLRDLYTSAQDHDNPLILNALDCPMGNASIPPPPSFTYV